MAALAAGTEVLIRYQVEGPVVCHARLILAHVTDDIYIITTPDEDIYAEDYGADSEDISVVRARPAGGALPCGVVGQNVYDFRVRPNETETHVLKIDGEAEAYRERVRRGVPHPVRVPDQLMPPAAVPDALPLMPPPLTAAPGVAPVADPGPALALPPWGGPVAPPMPAAAPAAAPAFPPMPPWGVAGANPPPVPMPVFLPPANPVGVLVAPAATTPAAAPAAASAVAPAAASGAPAGLVAAGGAATPAPAAGAALPFDASFNGLLEVAGGRPGPGGRARATAPERITDDARTCTVKFDDAGKRFREYREAVNMLHEDPWSDWPLTGPRVFLWGARFMLENGGTPTGWHSKWRADGKLQSSDPGVIVHEEFCRMIQTQMCYDQANSANLASSEQMMRQLMLIEEKFKDRFVGNGSHELSEEAHLDGGHMQRANICVSPPLSEWVAEEVRKEHVVLKERRKAREERALARPKK